MKEGIEFVTRRDKPYGQPWSVWDNGQIIAFCYTEEGAKQAQETRAKLRLAVNKAKKV